MTIRTEQGLIYRLRHEPDGLHMSCAAGTAPGLIFDEHIDGITWPNPGRPMSIAGCGRSTPPVLSVTVDATGPASSV